MSTNTSSTSRTTKSATQCKSQICTLTPDKLKKFGISEKLKRVQNEIESKNPVELVRNVDRHTVTPQSKLSIQKKINKIVSKKKTYDKENKRVFSTLKSPRYHERNKEISQIHNEKREGKGKPLVIPKELVTEKKVKSSQKIFPEDNKGTDESSGRRKFISGDKNLETNDEKLVQDTIVTEELVKFEADNGPPTIVSTQEDQLLEIIDSKGTRVAKISRRNGIMNRLKKAPIGKMRNSDKEITEELKDTGFDQLAGILNLDKLEYEGGPCDIGSSSKATIDDILGTGNTEISMNDGLLIHQHSIIDSLSQRSDPKSTNESLEEMQDFLHSRQLQQIQTKENFPSFTSTKNLKSLRRRSNKTLRKTSFEIVPQLSRGDKKLDKIPSPSFKQNDNELNYSLLPPTNPGELSTGDQIKFSGKLITNLTMPEKFQGSNNTQNDLNPLKSSLKASSLLDLMQESENCTSNIELLSLKSLINFDIPMTAAHSNSKQEDEILSSVTHSKNYESEKNPELLTKPVITEIIDNNEPYGSSTQPKVSSAGEPSAFTAVDPKHQRRKRRSELHRLLLSSVTFSSASQCPKALLQDSETCHQKRLTRSSSLLQSRRNETCKYTSRIIPEGTLSSSPVKLQLNLTKCAKCQQKMPLSSWAHHNLMKHNNMGWRSGDRVPDFSDLKSLSLLLSQAKKQKSLLTCENCRTKRNSVAGFISHITFCGKSEAEKEALMWKCPTCNVILFPRYQGAHEKLHRKQRIIVSESAQKIIEEAIGGNSSRVKRKAAKRASKRMFETRDLVEKSGGLPPKKRKLHIRINNLKDAKQCRKTMPERRKVLSARVIKVRGKNHCRKPGCDFSSGIVQDICEHSSICNITRRSLICKICQRSYKNEAECIEHIKKGNSNEFNDNDFHVNIKEESRGQQVPGKGEKRRRRQLESRASTGPRANFLRNSIYVKNLSDNMTFRPALEWTIEFQIKHYKLRLFEELQINGFEVVDKPEEYLPKLQLSMPTTVLGLEKREVREEDWRRWYKFEADVVGKIPTFFTGGPIWGLAWMPIPATMYNKKPQQFVAVSTHKGMEDYFEVGRSYSGKNCIQIWNLGALSNDSERLTTPELCYAVGHDGGTIWCLEWCPSGGYEPGGKRMGLLAAAMSSGLVHIYSMPFPEVAGVGGKIFKTDPVFVLHVNDHGANTSQCMTLNWSKTSNHDTLVAGFANGYVALWSLTTKSPLLRRKEGSTIHMQPFIHFHAHKHAVMFVTIVPLKEKRYLVTAGMDRYSKTWDLEETSAPFWLIKKGVAVNGTWITHWPTILTSYDDVLGLKHTMTHLAPIREAPSKIVPILATNTPVFAICSSDWANGICQGTGAGEIVATFPMQMLYAKKDSTMRKRWLVSNVEIIDFEKTKEEMKKEYEYKPAKYDECAKRFGLVFREDLDNTRGASSMSQRNKQVFLNPNTMQMLPVEQYPIAAINRITWNPNGWSYLWMAIGYRNGLVRILKLTGMNKTSISSDMLFKHASATRNKEEELKKL